MSNFVLLGEHISVQKGKAPLSFGDVGHQAEPYLNPEYLRGRARPELAKAGPDSVRATDGDTILLWDGSNAGEFFKGKSGLVASTMAKLMPSSAFLASYFFHAAKHAECHLRSQTSGTGIPHVDRGLLNAIKVFCPPANEQKRIAEILDTCDAAIQKTEALIDNLKAIKQGLLHDLLTRGIDTNGQLRPPQAEAPRRYKNSTVGWVPTEWEVSLLQDLVCSRSPITYGVVQPGPEVDGGVRFVRGGDIFGGRIQIDQLRTIGLDVANSYGRTRLVGGELLMSLVGYPGEVGLVPPVLAGANIARQAALIRITDAATSKYVMHYLSSRMGKRQVLGQSLGSAQQVVNLSDLRNVRVPLPPHEERRAISERVETFNETMEKEAVNLGKLAELKSALMDDLLTGRVRVTPLLERTAA